MPGYTPNLDAPYPLPTEAISGYPAVAKSLALIFDALGGAVPAGRAAGGAQQAALQNGSTNMGTGGSTYGVSTIQQGGVTYSTSTGFFTVPAGLYSCSGWANLLLNSLSQTENAYWQLSLLHNGIGYNAGPANGLFTNGTMPYAGISLTDLISCAAGDTIGLQAGGANMSNPIAFNNYAFAVAKLGAA